LLFDCDDGVKLAPSCARSGRMPIFAASNNTATGFAARADDPRRMPMYRIAGTVIWFTIAAATCAHAAADVEPKRVLIVHSFARDAALFGSVGSTFRTLLTERLAAPLIFDEIALETGEHGTVDAAPIIAFLNARFAQHAPDLLVALGPPAAVFCATHRAELFPSTARILAGDGRFLGSLPGAMVTRWSRRRRRCRRTSTTCCNCSRKRTSRRSYSARRRLNGSG
jgi:hypothetical protein